MRPCPQAEALLAAAGEVRRSGEQVQIVGGRLAVGENGREIAVCALPVRRTVGAPAGWLPHAPSVAPVPGVAPAPRTGASTERLVNTLSILSPYGPEEKQCLLEARDLRARAEALVALAEMELAARDDGSGTSLQ